MKFYLGKHYYDEWGVPDGRPFLEIIEGEKWIQSISVASILVRLGVPQTQDEQEIKQLVSQFIQQEYGITEPHFLTFKEFHGAFPEAYGTQNMDAMIP